MRASNRLSNEGFVLLCSKNQDCLGEKVKERFGGQLPFLFKVLSVNKVTILIGTATFLFNFR